MSPTHMFWSESSRKFCARLRDLLSTKLSIMVESHFKETTRNGNVILRFVRLALTSDGFVIASEVEHASSSRVGRSCLNLNSRELVTLYPWRSVKLYIFKKSRRHSIKASFPNNSTRYFELWEVPRMKFYWKFWRSYIEELNTSKRRWPFPVVFDDLYANVKVKNEEKKLPTRKWSDKYLYLGSVREVEDKIRPRPVPGLGKTEEIKLLYLKPRYFGCWEQSEHWVQCGESSLEMDCLKK